MEGLEGRMMYCLPGKQVVYDKKEWYDVIDTEIEDFKSDYELPVLGSDRLIDLKRLTSLFTVVNSNVLINYKSSQEIWSKLRVFLKQKGDPVYRSAKKIVLAYMFIRMTSNERNNLVLFFNSKRYFYRYKDFSYTSGLTVKTLKNFSGYIGTESFKPILKPV